MTDRPYAGPVEALSVEEAAVRVRLSADAFEKLYSGRWTYLGRLKRVTAADLHEWLQKDQTAPIATDRFQGNGHGQGALSKREQDQVA